MPDLNRESLEIWNNLKPMVDEEIKSQTRGAVQRRKAKVTTAPSLSTNKIGVTEPYCAEIFIPFVSNLISATVGDYVWIEFAYGATNAYASMFASSDHKDETVARNLYVMGNVNVGGVLDVTNRRCEATIPANSAGWYRVFDYSAANADRVSGDIAFSIDITILERARQYHKITLYGIVGALKFGDEISVTNISIVDKIRYVKDGTHGYIDVHFSYSASRHLACYFDVKCNYSNIHGSFTSVTPTLTADSPVSPATVLTEYTFVANNTTRLFANATKDSSFNAATFTLNCFVYLQIGIMVVTYNIKCPALSAGVETLMGTFPNGYRPSLKENFTICGQSGNPYLLQVYTDGRVTIYSDSASTEQFIRGTLTLPLY